MTSPIEDRQARSSAERCSSLHLRVGWLALAIFASLGLTLEILHGFKVSFYLDVDQETRRLMWTLAHTHGTLLGLLNVAFAWSVSQLSGWDAARRRLASLCLRGATLLLPLGFFLGGLKTYGGDPGLGILLSPPGGALLVGALALTAQTAWRK